jgi:hypothetical protein
MRPVPRSLIKEPLLLWDVSVVMKTLSRVEGANQNGAQETPESDNSTRLGL